LLLPAFPGFSAYGCVFRRIWWAFHNHFKWHFADAQPFIALKHFNHNPVPAFAA